MARKVSIAILAGVLFAVPSSAAACENENLTPPELKVTQARESVLCLINEKRKRAGARKLRSNSRLERAAQEHSAAMDAGDFFSHSGLNGSSPLSRIQGTGYLAGAGSWAVAENLRWGQASESSPRAAISGWMSSPPHRRAMLSRRYRHVGIGVVIGSPTGSSPNSAIYTTDFGFKK